LWPISSGIAKRVNEKPVRLPCLGSFGSGSSRSCIDRRLMFNVVERLIECSSTLTARSCDRSEPTKICAVSASLVKTSLPRAARFRLKTLQVYSLWRQKTRNVTREKRLVKCCKPPAEAARQACAQVPKTKAMARRTDRRPTSLPISHASRHVLPPIRLSARPKNRCLGWRFHGGAGGHAG